MAKAAQEPFLNGSSSVYVEEMYRSWQKDPNSVHKVCSTLSYGLFILFTPIFRIQSWDAFFKSATAGAQPGQAYQSPPSLAGSSPSPPLPSQGVAPNGAPALRNIDDHLSVQAIIRSYQVSWYK